MQANLGDWYKNYYFDRMFPSRHVYRDEPETQSDNIVQFPVEKLKRHTSILYLAGPIAGCSLEEAKGWREIVKTNLNPNISCINPIRNTKEWDKNGTASIEGQSDCPTVATRALAVRSYMDVRRSNGIFCYLPKFMNERRPSVGTIMEIAYGHALGIPTLLVTDDDYFKRHPLMQECVGWNVNTIEEGIYVANTIFG